MSKINNKMISKMTKITQKKNKKTKIMGIEEKKEKL